MKTTRRENNDLFQLARDAYDPIKLIEEELPKWYEIKKLGYDATYFLKNNIIGCCHNATGNGIMKKDCSNDAHVLKPKWLFDFLPFYVGVLLAVIGFMGFTFLIQFVASPRTLERDSVEFVKDNLVFVWLNPFICFGVAFLILFRLSHLLRFFELKNALAAHRETIMAKSGFSALKQSEMVQKYLNDQINGAEKTLLGDESELGKLQEQAEALLAEGKEIRESLRLEIALLERNGREVPAYIVASLRQGNEFVKRQEAILSDITTHSSRCKAIIEKCREEFGLLEKPFVHLKLIERLAAAEQTQIKLHADAQAAFLESIQEFQQCFTRLQVMATSIGRDVGSSLALLVDPRSSSLHDRGEILESAVAAVSQAVNPEALKLAE